MVEGAFFQDLAVLMVLAGIVSAIFSRLGWPKALGYILVGVLMSEHTWGGSFLLDAESVRILAQLGVVFLMFGMGLDFSAKDMKKIKGVVLPVAVADVLVMTWLGWLVGTKVFHWNTIQSLFLGVAICDSATTLLAKVIDEMGWGRRAFAKYVLGTSVCEDILCVGAIAVATGCAQGGGMSAGAFLASLGWLVLFFVATLVFGLIVVPRLMQRVGRNRDNEALLLAMLGCCFLVSYIAYKFEFSLALGAFLVGLLCATSVERERLGQLVDPLKSMFSAMFFVTIGLLVDPVALGRFLPHILLVSLVIVLGKCTNITFVSLATGLDVKTSVQNGMSLAQIGEFAFMTAILYADLVEDVRTPLFQIAVGASLLTTLLNPLFVRTSEKVGESTARHLPKSVKELLLEYRGWLAKIGASKGSLAYVLARQAAVKLIVYAALILAVGVTCTLLNHLDYTRFSVSFQHWKEWVFFAGANLFSVSILPLVHYATRSLGDEVAEMVAGEGNAAWQGPVRHVVRFAVHVAVAALFFLEVSAINLSAFPHSAAASWTVFGVLVVVGAVGWRFFARAGHRAAAQLHEAITAEERRADTLEPLAFALPEGSIAHVRVAAASAAVGRTLGELDVRAHTGATVISVRRGGLVHHDIGADWRCEANDVLVALGDAGQIDGLTRLVGPAA